MCDNTVINAPLPNRPFLLYMDASDAGFRAILTQETNPQGEQPTFFLRRKLNKAKRNYAVIEKETLAIRWTVKEFKYYLWGSHFMVVTDHAPLQWLNHMKETNPRLIRWYLILQLYHFTMKYRQGQQHTNTDFFS